MSRSAYDPADPGLVPTIGELITQFRDLTGDTYREMAERAERAGFTIKYQTIQELAKDGPKGWPKNPETIVALAVAMHMSQRVIVLAFARAFGLDVDSVDRRVVGAPEYVTGREMWDQLSASGREELIAVLKEYIDEQLAQTRSEGGGESGDSAPTKQDVTLAARKGEPNLARRRGGDPLPPDPEGPAGGA